MSKEAEITPIPNKFELKNNEDIEFLYKFDKKLNIIWAKEKKLSNCFMIAKLFTKKGRKFESNKISLEKLNNYLIRFN